MTAKRLLHAALTGLLLTGGALVLALATGEVSFVTTHGVSMLPRFHTGDLAIVVRSVGYHVGEIVAYHSPTLHVVVLHRIVAEHGGRFTFKGDNNHFVDQTRLPASAIVGRLLFRIPRGGAVLASLHSPSGIAAILAALLAIGAMKASSTPHPAHAARRRRPARQPAAASPELPRPAPLGQPEEPVARALTDSWPALAAAALVVLSSVLAASWWTHPTTTTVQRSVSYRQQVTFSYSAGAPAGIAYPTGLVATGDPVFLHLVSDLQVTARYQLVLPTGIPGRTAGTIGATALLEAPGGWSETLASASPTPFRGREASVHLAVGVSAIDQLAQTFQQQTGVPLDATNVEVMPTVTLHGTVDGTPMTATTAPPLNFQIDAQELTLAETPGPNGAPTFPQLHAVSRGAVPATTVVPAQVALLGHQLGVGTARLLGLVALLLSLIGTSVAVRWVQVRRHLDDTQRIRARHRGEMVPVGASPEGRGPAVFDVDSMAALERLADRYEAVLLEHRHDGGCSYYVEAGAFLYRFTAPGGPGSAARDAQIWERLRHMGITDPPTGRSHVSV